MLKFGLQTFGGRGGSSGRGGGPAIGGKSGTIYIVGGRAGNTSQTVTGFTGGSGMVAEVSIGSNNRHDKGYLDPASYDIYTKGGQHAANIRFGDKSSLGDMVIGVRLNTPNGASQRQSDYAKTVAANRLNNVLSQSAARISSGRGTAQQLVNELKAVPAMDARTILDKWKR